MLKKAIFWKISLLPVAPSTFPSTPLPHQHQVSESKRGHQGTSEVDEETAGEKKNPESLRWASVHTKASRIKYIMSAT